MRVTNITRMLSSLRSSGQDDDLHTAAASMVIVKYNIERLFMILR